MSDTPVRKKSARRPIPREVRTLVGGAVVVLIGALALPRILSPGDDAAPHEAEIVPPTRPAPKPAPAAGAAKPSPRSATAAPQPGHPLGPAVASARDGDLVVEVKLRWQQAAAGTTLPGVVRLRNGGQTAFHLPAATEPHPTLTLVVLDAEGRVVRRIAEASTDPYPRRTTLVHPAETLEVPMVVVAGEDKPLEPGDYTVYAELRNDPVWDRLGIPMWKEPKGTARSIQEPFRITAKTE